MSRNSDRQGVELKELERRIENWRRRRPTRAMPEELWEAAVALAREDGVSAVSRALRLGYHSLKQRRNASGSGATDPSAVKFVELPPEPWLRSGPARSPEVELWAGDGSRLVIRLPGGSSADLAHLAAVLWRDR